MCKIKLDKILNLKKKLYDFLPLMPISRSSKIKVDLDNLFKNVENKNYLDLEEIEKLSKVKIQAYNRIYGNQLNNNQGTKIIDKELSNDKENITYFKKEARENIVDNKERLLKGMFSNSKIGIGNLNEMDKPVFSKEEEEKLIKEFEVNLKDKWESNYDEIKNSDGFNKEKVEKLQQLYMTTLKELEDKRIKSEFIAIKERIKILRDKGEEDSIKEEFDKINFFDSSLFDENKKIIIEKFKERYVIMYNTYFNQGGEESFSKLNLDELSKTYRSDDQNINNNVNKENIENIENKENEQSRNLFKPEEVKQSNDGYIEMNALGDFKIVMFEDDKNGVVDDIQTSNDDPTRENFVWKDGKLIPGEALKRKVVSHINWNSSNLDPHDLKKHKELLHRQHFGGPLWDGIKKINSWDKPIVLEEADLEESLSVEEHEKQIKELDKRIGKKQSKFEDIIR